MRLLVSGESAPCKQHSLVDMSSRMQISEAIVQDCGYLINLTFAAVDSCNVENVLWDSNRFSIEGQLDRTCFVMLLDARSCCQLAPSGSSLGVSLRVRCYVTYLVTILFQEIVVELM